MSRFTEIGDNLDLTFGDNLNANFTKADAELKRIEAKGVAVDASLQTQISEEQSARIAADQAHASAAVAHKAEQIEYAAGVSVKQQVDFVDARVNTIIQGSSGTKDAELTDIRTGADGVVRATAGAMVREIHAKQLAQADQTATIKRGLNVVQSSQASGAKVKVQGRTLVNILGNDGGCESLTPFSISGTVELSTTQKRSGNSALKVTTNGLATKDYNYKLDSSKLYFVGAWVYIETYTSGNVSLRLHDVGASTNLRYSKNAVNTVVGAWQFVYILVPSANILQGEGFRLVFGVPSGDVTAYIDEIRLYEVSTADYNAIGTTYATSDAIDAFLPYVDGVKHLQGVAVRKSGKNLLSSIPHIIYANAVINTAYELTLNATTAWQYSYIYASDVFDNVQYTLSIDGLVTNQIITIDFINDSGTQIGSPITMAAGTGRTRVFTTPVGTKHLQISFTSAAAGMFLFKNWQLELGSAATPFEPRNDDYIHVPTVLASNVDRSITDSYDSDSGRVFRRWKTGVVLDGSLAWSDYSIFDGFKCINVSVGPNGISSYPQGVLTKYNGYPLKNQSGLIGAFATSDLWQLGQLGTSNYNSLYITISNAESGWVDGTNPNANAIKALMNGWKATANNGTVYNSWVAVLDGSAPTTNTEAWCAANKAPGWTGWATLDYVLAQPFEEPLIGDTGAISLQAGSNQIELLEGVVVREKAAPKLDSGFYYINRTSLAGSNLKNRSTLIIAIYKGIKNDTSKWTIYQMAPTSAYGLSDAKIPAADYDTTAEYFVDYFVLDRYAYSANAIDATLQYRTNPEMVQRQLMQDVADLETQVGVNVWALAELYKKVKALGG